MSIKIGDVDVVQEIIELRHQLLRTQMILELVINKNSANMQLPTKEEIQAIEEEAITKLIERYPNSVSRK